jgi:hypothetical protein
LQNTQALEGTNALMKQNCKQTWRNKRLAGFQPLLAYPCMLQQAFRLPGNHSVNFRAQVAGAERRTKRAIKGLYTNRERCRAGLQKAAVLGNRRDRDRSCQDPPRVPHETASRRTHPPGKAHRHFCWSVCCLVCRRMKAKSAPINVSQAGTFGWEVTWERSILSEDMLFMAMLAAIRSIAKGSMSLATICPTPGTSRAYRSARSPVADSASKTRKPLFSLAAWKVSDTCASATDPGFCASSHSPDADSVKLADMLDEFESASMRSRSFSSALSRAAACS